MSQTNKLVPLGQIVVTASISTKMNNSSDFTLWINNCIKRHQSGDWGDCCQDDKNYNNSALHWDERLLSLYKAPIDLNTNIDKIWIITEWDRSVTTVFVAFGVLKYSYNY